MADSSEDHRAQAAPLAKRRLRRGVSLPLLTLYGLGTTIGAGIYVIVGATAAKAGYYTPLAFLAASLIAGLSAASFAELCTRFPVAAGEAAYIRAGLGFKGLSTVIGLAIAFSGTVSSATLLQGGTAYLGELIELPRAVMLLTMLAALGALAVWGIGISVVLAALLTLVEIGGLLVIISAAPADPLSLIALTWHNAPSFDATVLAGMSTAILLAFFAFIGFEDMVNLVEEVKSPRRTMPRAIALTLGVTAVLYIWVTLVAVTALPPEELGACEAPLTCVVRSLTGRDPAIFNLIAIVAVVNGVIIQLLMSSRIIYGLAKLGQVPTVLGQVSSLTRTPVVATLLVCAVVALLSLTLPMTALAQTTSSFTLATFALVNLALWRIKRRTPEAPLAFRIPALIPVIGFTLSFGFLVIELSRRAVGLFTEAAA